MSHHSSVLSSQDSYHFKKSLFLQSRCAICFICVCTLFPIVLHFTFELLIDLLMSTLFALHYLLFTKKNILIEKFAMKKNHAGPATASSVKAVQQTHSQSS